MLLTFVSAKPPYGKIHLDPEGVRTVEELDVRGMKAAQLTMESGERFILRDEERTVADTINAYLAEVFYGGDQGEISDPGAGERR